MKIDMEIRRIDNDTIEVFVPFENINNIGLSPKDLENQTIKAIKFMDFVLSTVENKLSIDLKATPIGVSLSGNPDKDVNLKITILIMRDMQNIEEALNNIGHSEMVQDMLEEIRNKFNDKDKDKDKGIGTDRFTDNDNIITSNNESYTIYEFSKLDDIIEVCSIICNMLDEDIDFVFESSVFKYNNKYYLVYSLINNDYVELNLMLSGVFGEMMANKYTGDNLFKALLCEHGKVIVKEDAINVLSNLH